MRRFEIGKKRDVKSICIIANVGKDKLNETFLATASRTGNHWVCFLIDFESAVTFYFDSLAWNVPNNFLEQLKFVTNVAKKVYGVVTEITLEVAHDIPDKQRKCDRHCYQNAPFQGPNINVCRVVCIITEILLTDPDIKQSLSPKRALPTAYKWLKTVYNYNTYARYVLIKWYVEGKISASDIAASTEEV